MIDMSSNADHEQVGESVNGRRCTLDRRDFVKTAVVGAVAGVCGLTASGLSADEPGVKEARYYETLAGGKVRCTLCPWQCVTSHGQRGLCRVRENRRGKYYTLVYGEAAALHVDPIEKKPLFHFMPGTQALSVGTAGCNLRCKHCQNWEISQRTPEELRAQGSLKAASPHQLVTTAMQHSIPTIAYTYNEPIVFYEYMYDTARLASANRIKSVMISSGGINREPTLALAPYMDAIKIDLKGFSQEFYTEFTSGKLEHIQTTIKRLVALGKWIEIVYLVIPTANDRPDTIKAMAEWVVRAAGTHVPVHFTRFHPAFKLQNLPPTPLDTLIKCHGIARAAGLKYVYLGNIPGTEYASTYCPGCGKVVLKREGYRILSSDIKPNGACRFCGRTVEGVW